MKTTITALVLAASIASAHAGGDNVLQSVQSCLNYNDTFCTGLAIGTMRSLGYTGLICTGKTTYGQAHAMFIKWAKANPEYWDEDFVERYADYIVTNWRCKKSQAPSGAPGVF